MARPEAAPADAAGCGGEGGDSDGGGFTLVPPDAVQHNGAASSSDDDDSEEWSIPESAITFSREGWQRYCAEMGVDAGAQAGWEDSVEADEDEEQRAAELARAAHAAELQRQAAEHHAGAAPRGAVNGGSCGAAAAAAPPSGATLVPPGAAAAEGTTSPAPAGKPWRLPRVHAAAPASGAAAPANCTPLLQQPLTEEARAAVAAAMARLTVAAPAWAEDVQRVDAALAAGVAAARQRRAAATVASDAQLPPHTLPQRDAT